MEETKYSLLSSNGRDDSTERGSLIDSHESASSLPKYSRWTALFWILSLVAIAALTHGVDKYLQSSGAAVVDHIAALSWHSPVYKDIVLHIDHVIPDGTLWPNDSNIFRQHPSPEVDAAWHEVAKANRIFVDKEDWIKLGLPPEKGAQWPGDPTGNTYMGEIQVFHLLHCLNVLRKGSFFHYYWPVKPVNPAYWTHYYHCLDVLRQEIMCLAPLDIAPLVWMENQSKPFPYFVMNRKCRRWDDVVRYRNEHQCTVEELKLMEDARKPEWQEQYSMPENAKELLKVYNEWSQMNKSEFVPNDECP